MTKRLTPRLTIVLLTLLLGGSASTVWAQQERQEPTEPLPPEQQEPIKSVPTDQLDAIEPLPTEQQDAVEPVPTEQLETQNVENAPATTAEETDADNSPFDYQSSEKISEDLAVSFPVDI